MKYAVIGGSLSGLAIQTIEELKKRGFHIFALDISHVPYLRQKSQNP